MDSFGAPPMSPFLARMIREARERADMRIVNGKWTAEGDGGKGGMGGAGGMGGMGGGGMSEARSVRPKRLKPPPSSNYPGPEADEALRSANARAQYRDLVAPNGDLSESQQRQARIAALLGEREKNYDESPEVRAARGLADNPTSLTDRGYTFAESNGRVVDGLDGLQDNDAEERDRLHGAGQYREKRLVGWDKNDKWFDKTAYAAMPDTQEERDLADAWWAQKSSTVPYKDPTGDTYGPGRRIRMALNNPANAGSIDGVDRRRKMLLDAGYTEDEADQLLTRGHLGSNTITDGRDMYRSLET